MKRRSKRCGPTGTLIVGAAVLLAAACSQPVAPVTELKRYPLNDLEGIITGSNVEFDRAVSRDANGSLRIRAGEPTVIRLFELGDLAVENARLICRAWLRTENVSGQVYQRESRQRQAESGHQRVGDCLDRRHSRRGRTPRVAWGAR